METLDYWRLCRRITLFQAIMLVLGYDPANDKGDDLERNGKIVLDGYGAVKTAFWEALTASDLKALCIVEDPMYDDHGEPCGTG